MKRAFTILGSLTALLALWQGIIWLSGVPPFILPTPWSVLVRALSSWETLARNGLVTLAEVLAGFILGSLFGMATAIMLLVSPALRRIATPVLLFSQSIPFFALAPILTLWLGFGVSAKIVITVLMIYFPVTSNFFDGLSRTDAGWLDLARVMRARRAQILWRIRLPAALPSLASGLKLGAVYAPVGAVVGEWVGSSSGLGYLMLRASGDAKTDLVFAALILVVLMTVLLYALISYFAERLNRRAEGLR